MTRGRPKGKGVPPFLKCSTGNPYLDVYVAAVLLAARDLQDSRASATHRLTATRFLTKDPMARQIYELIQQKESRIR